MMYGSKNTLGLRITRLRQDKGWTQKELASRAGITENQVSRIEKDKMQPRRSTIKALANAFEIGFEDLEALALISDDDASVQINQSDPDLAALISQIPLLSEQQKDALRVTLRSMIAYQKVRQATGAAAG